MTIVYRRAEFGDLQNIGDFVDWWLAGKAKKAGVPNAGADYFIPRKRHSDYLRDKIVLLAISSSESENPIVGWGVKDKNNALLHLLISANYRGQGIGAKMLKMLNPDIIRSKSDQTTGNPAEFYEKNGYTLCNTIKIGKNKNIDLMMKDRSKTK